MESDPVFVKVARLADIAEKRCMKVKVGDDEIALWRVNGRVYALSNVCAHQHFSALHQGILSGLTVACPMHGWTYSLETGRAENGEGRVKTYTVKIERDDVYLQW